MFNGAHTVIYSNNAEADRAVLRDVVGLSHVDVGGGWLIFALPDSEIAVHPHQTSTKHEFFFMCEDISETHQKLTDAGLQTSPVKDEGFGLMSSFTLPGGSEIGFYQPRHERPK